MDALRTGIMTLFNAGGDFYTDVNGRLFYGEAPVGTNLSEGPYAIFFFVTDVNDDTFSEEMKAVYVQFSLFSGESQPATILNMDRHLSSMFKDVIFAVTGWTVVVMEREQGNGPHSNPADVEAGTGFYWQMDVDFKCLLNKD